MSHVSAYPSDSRAANDASRPAERRTRARWIVRLLMGLVIETGRGMLMLAPVIAPPEDEA
jgi:hypothetical protein